MYYYASPQKNHDGVYIISWIEGNETKFERYPTVIEAMTALTTYSARYPDNDYVLSKVMQKISDTIVRKASLTQRQRQVMDLVLCGHSSKNIGLIMGLSPRTVEHYRTRINTKMGVQSFADLVRMCDAVAP